MSSVEEDKYLGDVISAEGKNTKYVASRISKGVGIITQINHMLEMGAWDIIMLKLHYYLE